MAKGSNVCDSAWNEVEAALKEVNKLINTTPKQQQHHHAQRISLAAVIQTDRQTDRRTDMYDAMAIRKRLLHVTVSHITVIERLPRYTHTHTHTHTRRERSITRNPVDT